MITLLQTPCDANHAVRISHELSCTKQAVQQLKYTTKRHTASCSHLATVVFYDIDFPSFPSRVNPPLYAERFPGDCLEQASERLCNYAVQSCTAITSIILFRRMLNLFDCERLPSADVSLAKHLTRARGA
jgi:hypothetical protein